VILSVVPQIGGDASRKSGHQRGSEPGILSSRVLVSVGPFFCLLGFLVEGTAESSRMTWHTALLANPLVMPQGRYIS
jgi:hypothetical protein